MPEENWAVHGGIPACDLCHSRKVKCDRQDPCKNCVNANVHCLRTRQKRTHHPRIRTDDKIKALVEKLSSLENAVRQNVPHAQSTASASTIKSHPISITDDDISPPPLKRSRTNAPLTQNLLGSPDSVTSPLHRNGDARDHIEKELSSNESLAAHQRTVFETAIAFIDQLSQAPSSNVEAEVWNSNVPTDFAKGELVQIMLAGQQNDFNRPGTQLSLLDHIPPKAVERMALCLLDGTSDERTLYLCKVVVHFKAGLGLYASQLHTPKNQKIREHVKEMQLRHLNAALTALDAVGFLSPPSLLLLQALLTGVILMYILGNSQSCWSLTAYASRTLVALGYHNISSGQVSHTKTEDEQEIHAAVAWCYHFDRVMSLLLLRPLSLPPLQVSITSLVEYSPHNRMAIFALVMLELVPIHDKILELTLAGPKGKIEKTEVESQVEELRRKMEDIYLTMERARANSDAADTPDYHLHWHSLEFKYFSSLTAVHRLSPNVCFRAAEREKCLYAARRALQCVKHIQDLATQQDHFLEEYNPYLSWTILSYPLSPFFVLFCNVVGTSDLHDFQLLQDVVDSVSSLVMENKYVERLRRLCNMLLALCRPLVYANVPPSGMPTQERQHALSNAEGNAAAVGVDPAVTAMLELSGAQEVPATREVVAEAWQDDMMWQLFQAQPSLDWFNSDILDPGTWDLNLPS